MLVTGRKAEVEAKGSIRSSRTAELGARPAGGERPEIRGAAPSAAPDQRMGRDRFAEALADAREQIACSKALESLCRPFRIWRHREGRCRAAPSEVRRRSRARGVREFAPTRARRRRCRRRDVPSPLLPAERAAAPPDQLRRGARAAAGGGAALPRRRPPAPALRVARRVPHAAAAVRVAADARREDARDAPADFRRAEGTEPIHVGHRARGGFDGAKARRRAPPRLGRGRRSACTRMIVGVVRVGRTIRAAELADVAGREAVEAAARAAGALGRPTSSRSNRRAGCAAASPPRRPTRACGLPTPSAPATFARGEKIVRERRPALQCALVRSLVDLPLPRGAASSCT